MLKDLTVRAFAYDRGSDEVRLEVGEVGSAPSGGAKSVEGQLLLDAAGFLVGIDLGGEGLSRAIAMLGPHEKVDRAEPSTLSVRADTAGTAVEVVVKGAMRAIRGAEKNPYLP
jgi:hypothetical protein